MVGFDNMTEFTCHIGSGRKALMETALETSISGYINRKLNYFLMDVITSYSGEIRL
jgi:DNA-directed RNA polymerase beta' subunit